MTPFRDPRTLTIVVTEHEFRGETSVLITEQSTLGDLTVYDGWAVCGSHLLAGRISDVADVWFRVGALAAAATARHIIGSSAPRGR